MRWWWEREREEEGECIRELEMDEAGAVSFARVSEASTEEAGLYGRGGSAVAGMRRRSSLEMRGSLRLRLIGKRECTKRVKVERRRW